MAELRAHDVVNQAQSVGDSSPSDVPATNIQTSRAGGDVEGTLISGTKFTNIQSQEDKPHPTFSLKQAETLPEGQTGGTPEHEGETQVHYSVLLITLG
jgi:hypothetical protein